MDKEERTKLALALIKAIAETLTGDNAEATPFMLDMLHKKVCTVESQLHDYFKLLTRRLDQIQTSSTFLTADLWNQHMAAEAHRHTDLATAIGAVHRRINDVERLIMERLTKERDRASDYEE